ncbi:hypothetical protein HMPREF9069_00771 [Atopobium sp. oral taxon 810 str. F0209]|nr:hypothetical protein HMPREF9069_00771 [Atopobium sp. oral taxon 810 str. F0209]
MDGSAGILLLAGGSQCILLPTSGSRSTPSKKFICETPERSDAFEPSVGNRLQRVHNTPFCLHQVQ